MYFLRSSYMQPCGGNCPTAEGQGSQKIVCFAHKLLFCHIFVHFFGSWFCIQGALRVPQAAVHALQAVVRAPQAAVRTPQAAVRAPTTPCAPFKQSCAPLRRPCVPPPRHACPSAYNVMAKDPTWQRCGSHRVQSNSGFTLSEVNMPLTLM
jgi:hypothetical protein